MADVCLWSIGYVLGGAATWEGERKTPALIHSQLGTRQTELVFPGMLGAGKGSGRGGGSVKGRFPKGHTWTASSKEVGINQVARWPVRGMLPWRNAVCAKTYWVRVDQHITGAVMAKRGSKDHRALGAHGSLNLTLKTTMSVERFWSGEGSLGCVQRGGGRD